MINQIFLDLDDVCNTLAMYALHVQGIDISPTDYSAYPVECGYDIIAAANLLGQGYCTVASFWDAITRKHWASVPESTIFPWILDACENLVGQGNVCIATSPTKDPDSLAGKLEWIHEHFPSRMHREYAITPRKHLLAQPDTLLIDDNADNINTFIRKGGRGLLVPRPWNVYAGCDVQGYLKGQLQRISEE